MTSKLRNLSSAAAGDAVHPASSVPASSPSLEDSVLGESSVQSSRSLTSLELALLRGALEEIPFGIATTRGGTVVYANEACNRVFRAPPGGLDRRELSELFPPATYAEVAQSLESARIFDGRVRVRALDGSEPDADVHIEWYRSEAQGTGGFLVVRDVSFELGALARLVDQLGGVMFRTRVADGAIEMLSPSITKLTGLDAARCVQRPVLLTTLASSEERERLLFLYRRMCKGELLTANAQFNLRRVDGLSRVVQVRASARRDTRGLVRHIDGVVVEVAREVDAVHGLPKESAHTAKEPVLRAVMDLSYDLLREASQQVNMLAREVRAMRAVLKERAAELPGNLLAVLSASLDVLAGGAAAAGFLSREVRHALVRTTLGAPLGEIIEEVRVALEPLAGAPAMTIDATDAAGLVIPDHVEELTLAITHLSLRAFRFAGSGSLSIRAYRGHCPEPRGAGRRHGHERECAFIEILGAAPDDLAASMTEISSEMLRPVPRPDETKHAFAAAQALIAAVGGTIESDDATFATARTVVRLLV